MVLSLTIAAVATGCTAHADITSERTATPSAVVASEPTADLSRAFAAAPWSGTRSTSQVWDVGASDGLPAPCTASAIALTPLNSPVTSAGTTYANYLVESKGATCLLDSSHMRLRLSDGATTVPLDPRVFSSGGRAVVLVAHTALRLVIAGPTRCDGEAATSPATSGDTVQFGSANIRLPGIRLTVRKCKASPIEFAVSSDIGQGTGRTLRGLTASVFPATVQRTRNTLKYQFGLAARSSRVNLTGKCPTITQIVAGGQYEVAVRSTLNCKAQILPRGVTQPFELHVPLPHAMSTTRLTIAVSVENGPGASTIATVPTGEAR